LGGIKGGNRAAVTNETTRLILEAANFHPGRTRMSSNAVGIRNDASKRQENDVPLEYALEGLEKFSALIQTVSPDARFGPVLDVGTKVDPQKTIRTTAEAICRRIGMNIPESKIIEILGLCEMKTTVESDGSLTIVAPTYRKDISIDQDIAEEVGRIYGYENLPEGKPVHIESAYAPDPEYVISEKIRVSLAGLGWDEIIGYTLQSKGDFVLASPLSADKDKLRTGLHDTTVGYLESNSRYLDLLGVDQIKMFEIAHVFPAAGEKTCLSLGALNLKGAKCPKADAVIKEALSALAAAGIDFGSTDQMSMIKPAESKMAFDRKIEIAVAQDINFADMKFSGKLDDSKRDLKTGETAKFSPISTFPFVVRDVAVLVPGPADKADQVESLLISECKKNGTDADLLVRHKLFDVFTKQFDGEEKTSYAFRLVFQSQKRTLSEDEINSIMSGINSAILAKGWTVR